MKGRWVAIRIEDGTNKRWITSDKPLTQEDITKIDKKGKYQLDLFKYGFDFFMVRIFTTAFLFFDTKEKMEEAEATGFDECFQ